MTKLNLNNSWITKNIDSRLYQLPAPIIGLTGGIATGKSTVSKLFKDLNFAMIDADQLVKKIYQKVEVLNFVQNNFPSCINDDQINFKELRKVAFSNSKNIGKIEKVIYQYLPNEFKQAFLELGSPNLVIYDVPLLFEKNLNLLVDISLCVYAPREIQLKRLMDRDKITETLGLEILNHQMDIELKKEKADLIIDNVGNIDQLKLNFKNLCNQLFI